MTDIGDPGPTLAPTTLATQASPDVSIGAGIHDTATLDGGAAPTGTIAFSLYGPDDAHCSGPPLTTSTRTVDGAGSYESDSFEPKRPGTYRWVAAYGGDVANAPSAGSCGDAGESVTVTRTPTAVTASASPAVPAGGRIHVTATLAGGVDPTGTLSFALYGPGDPDCKRAAIASSTRPLNGSHTYDSSEFVAARAGVYRWVVSYGGDEANAPSGGGCADSGASVTVARAHPTLTVAPSPSVVEGGQIHASAVLKGGVGPTGSIAFRLYGPDDPACSGRPLRRSATGVDGPGAYGSGSVTAARPGTYRWVAEYAGDSDNVPVSTPCGDAGAVVVQVDHTKTTLDAGRGGEALLSLTAAAPGTDWGAAGRESAVATVTVDGRYSQDVVLFAGARPFTYRLALGRLLAGRHLIRVRFNPRKSPPGATAVVVDDMTARLAGPAEALAVRHAPILYGRDEPHAGGRYENNHTDVPLLSYHTSPPNPRGTTLEYTVVWSNEDGGTVIDAMMPRWGRTTDIEWVYRVSLDRRGRVVSEIYQDPAHHDLPFHGRRENDHPLLQTAAANNGVLAVTSTAHTSGYRFFMDPTDELATGRARESEMDAHPWTYALSAAEAGREHKLERRPSPSTTTVSDPRNYLFLRLGKTTTTSTSRGWIGTGVDVRLRGSSRWYHSDHDVPDWSVEPDGQVTTAVELPPGTGAEDIRALRAVAHRVGGVRGSWRVRVSDLAGAFLLDDAYRPAPLSGRRRVGVTLTPSKRSRWIWDRGGG